MKFSPPRFLPYPERTRSLRNNIRLKLGTRGATSSSGAPQPSTSKKICRCSRAVGDGPIQKIDKVAFSAAVLLANRSIAFFAVFLQLKKSCRHRKNKVGKQISMKKVRISRINQNRTEKKPRSSRTKANKQQIQNPNIDNKQPP